MINVSRLTPDIIQAYRELDTPCVSDALDRLGLRGGCEGLKPIVYGVKAVGPAFTVHYLPVGVRRGTVGDFIDDVAPEQVVVIDNGGRTYCTVWGDLLTLVATRRGVQGTVIDGVCRDVPRIRELRYPLFSKGHFMVTGKDRVEADAINVPVSICGVQVRPGDLIVADDSGVVVVPQEKVEEVLEAAQEIAAAEARIEEEIRRGTPLAEARRKVGYHSLQSRR